MEKTISEKVAGSTSSLTKGKEERERNYYSINGIGGLFFNQEFI